MGPPRALAILALLCASACSGLISKPRTHAELRPEELGRTFEPEELARDLRFLVEVCEEVHPRPWALRSRQEIDALLDELVASIDQPLARTDFWPLAARLAAALGDAHTWVLPPVEEWSAFASAEPLLPLAVEARDGALFVVQSLADETAPALGSELRRVDDVDLRELLRAHRALRAGPPAFVDASFASNLRFFLWLAGARAPFDVHTDDESGGCSVLAGLAGLSAAELQARDRARPAEASWSLEWLAGEVALIRFQHMGDADAWAEFLHASFQEIRSRDARGVVVDLRHNGGGDSALGDMLLAYLNDEPYRMCARKEWRSSARYRRHLKEHVPAWLRWLPLQYVHPFGRAFWGVEEGGILVQEHELVQPESEPLRFAGPWCLLIGPATFSSATMLANAVGDHALAPLFGAETGGVPSSFGEIYACDLPSTRLELLVSSAYYVRANGDGEDHRGVLPTHPVSPGPADLAEGRDAVLEAARAWILAETGQ